MRWLLKAMDKITADCATHLLAMGKGERAFLVGEGIASADRITVLGKGSIAGVDLARFCPNPEARQRFRQAHHITDEVVCLFLGRLNAEKGVYELARAFDLCVAENPALRLFNAGADKVSINSAAIARPQLIGEIGASFGAQAVIVAIDARRGPQGVADAEVYVSGGRKPTGLRVVDWAREAESRGAGEILLTSMDTDGMRRGFDLELTAAVSAAVQIPVIASGGAGTAAHFVDVFNAGRADAALAASIFHFGVTDSRALKAELQRAGVSVRLPC